MNTLNNTKNGFEPRDYEIKALDNLRVFFLQWFQGILENNIRHYETLEGKKEQIEFFTAALVHMATGSGKTFTVGTFIDFLFGLRERFKNTRKYENIPSLKILVLGNKIDLIDQLKQNFIDGNTIKGIPAIFSDTFKESLVIEKNHSRVKINEILKVPVGEEEKNEIVFSTFQTAKNNVDPSREFNIIIVDEAHNLTAKEYKEIFEKFYKPFHTGISGKQKFPLVFCMTATATDTLKKLVGNPVVDFSLPYYMASLYAPKVQYNIVTNQSISQETIEDILVNIKKIKGIHSIQEKKARLKILEEELNNSLGDYENDEILIADLKKRIPNIEQEKSILFVPNIQRANEIEKKINNNLSQGGALAYHSETNDQNVIQNFSNLPSFGIKKV